MKPISRRFISEIILGWLLLFFCSLSFAEKTSIEILSENNYKVLSGRVYAMLSYRFQKLNLCSLNYHRSFYDQYKNLKKYTDSPDEAAKYLQLYYDSYQVDKDCKKVLDEGELMFHRMERRNFSSFYLTVDKSCSSKKSSDFVYEGSNCKNELRKVLQDLNPHCISTQIDYNQKYKDSFECMVGDYLIGKILYHSFSTPEEYIKHTKEFFLNYWNLSYSEQSKPIELYDIYKLNQSDTLPVRKTFLATITMLLASTQSLSPYIKGFHDYFWRRKLFDSHNALASVQLFNSSKLLVDEFGTIHRLIQSKQKNILFLGQPINALNRHNYMATFLTCQYRDQPEPIKKGLPLLLGYAYESLDFISHIIKEGDTLEQATDNFTVDTNRYKLGVKLGDTFCGSTKK